MKKGPFSIEIVAFTVMVSGHNIAYILTYALNMNIFIVHVITQPAFWLVNQHRQPFGCLWLRQWFFQTGNLFSGLIEPFLWRSYWTTLRYILKHFVDQILEELWSFFCRFPRHVNSSETWNVFAPNVLDFFVV